MLPLVPGPGRAADAVSNAVYEELDYSAMPEYQEVPSRPGGCSPRAPALPREGAVPHIFTAAPGPGGLAVAPRQGPGVSLGPTAAPLCGVRLCHPRCQLRPRPSPCFSPAGSLSEGSVKKLPYYTGDSVEGSDTEAAPGRATGQEASGECWGQGTHSGRGAEGTSPPLVSVQQSIAFPCGTQGPPAHPRWQGRRGWHSQTPARATGSLPWTPVPVPDPPARPEHGTLDGYDDALDVPQEPPAPSTGDISEGVAQRRWICVLPTGKRAHSCPVPSAEALHGRVWLWGWAGIQQQMHGCCSQTPGGACQGGHGALCPHAPFCAVPKVGSTPLQIPREPPETPRNSPRRTQTMMMSAAAPWGRRHEDALAMPQPWGHVCGGVVGPCPQEGVALPTEVTPPCAALQGNSSCVGIFFDFSLNFPFFLLKTVVV